MGFWGFGDQDVEIINNKSLSAAPPKGIKNIVVKNEKKRKRKEESGKMPIMERVDKLINQ